MKKLHLLLLAVMTFAACAFAAPYDNWGRFRVISINTTNTGGGANVTTSQTNFPVLVRLTNTSSATGKDVLDTALANGADIRFTTSDGSTALSYQIDTWSASAAAIWVKVPTVTGSATTTIRMYWKNATATSASSGSAVFDSSNGFRAVWHLNESASPSVDATILNTNATWQNTPATTTGNIGAGIRLANPSGIANNASKHLTAAYNATSKNFLATSAGGVTITAWVNRATNNAAVEQGIAGRYNWSTNHRQALLAASTTQWKLWRSTNGTAEANFGNVTATNSAWVHLAAAVKNGKQILFVNGVGTSDSGTTASLPALDSAWTDNPFCIGRMNCSQTGAHQSIDGTVDEVTFSRTARSADWVKLSYETQKASPTAVTLAAGTAVPLSGFAYASPTASYPTGFTITSNIPSLTTGVPDSFSVSPAFPAGLALNKLSGVISGTPTALSSAANYTVTAYSTAGNLTANVNITTPYNAPTSLVYSTPSPTYTVGTANTANTPTVGGVFTKFSISPALSPGLAFDTLTGILTGTPTDTAALRTYSVTVFNDSGSIAQSLPIFVRPAALSAVTYSDNSIVTTTQYYVGTPIAAISPTVNAAVVPLVVDSFTISPALPTGLALDKFTGIISGTPTVASPYTRYTLTARNVNNSVTVIVQLIVIAAPTTLTYADENATYEGGLPIAGNWPTTDAIATNYTISPLLPAGMVFDTATGVISGRAPAAGASLVAYTLTAINPAGDVSKTVNITVTPAEDYSTGWANTKTINLNTGSDAATVTTGQSRFPVLVRLTSAHATVFTSSNLTGSDLRFSLADGTRLPYQIERWDSAGRKAEVWVGLDTVAPNGLTSFRIHYGNPAAATKSNGGRIFGYQNGYVGVWHMGDTTGILARPNAVFGAPTAKPSNNNTTFGSGSYTIRTGAIGLADTLRGAGSRQTPVSTSDYFNIGTAADNGTTPYTGNNTYSGYNDFTKGFSYTAWVKPTTPSSANTYFLSMARGTGDSDNVQIFSSASNGRTLQVQLDNNTSSGGGSRGSVANSLDTAVWQQIMVTMGTGRNPKWKLYRNGNLLAMATADSTTVTPRNVLRTNAWMGKSNYNPDQYFRGVIDEPRISSLVRSADWSKLEYKNQKIGTTPVFDLTYSTPSAMYTQSLTITPNTPTIVGAATRYKVAPDLPDGLVLNPTTGVISGAPLEASAATDYTISAFGDSSWSTTTTVNITVPLSPPANLTYSTPAPTYRAGDAIFPNNATVTNTVDSFTVDPNLPSGLLLNKTTGQITGTPATASSGTYVVTAYNFSGSDTQSVDINVLNAESYGSWANFKDFTLNTTIAGVTTSQANFPVLVRLTTAHRAIFQAAKAGGADIRFSKTDGTHLPYQIDQWRTIPTDTSAAIWVLADNVAGNSTTTLRMYYGNGSATDESRGYAVFDTSNAYQGAWHFPGLAADTAFDATKNGLKGISNGGILDTTGVIGRAKFYNNSNAMFYKMPGSASGPLNYPQNGTYTVSAWVRQVTTAASRTMVTKGDNQYALEARNSGSQWEFHEHRAEGDDLTSAPQAQTILGSWAYVVGVRNGVNQSIYVNGVLASNTINTDVSRAGARITDSALYIGKNSSGNNRPMLGMIDEVQISSAARSDDWIKLSYKNQKLAITPVTALTYSASSYSFLEKTLITPITAPTVIGTATRFEIAPTLPTGISFNTGTGAITGTPTDSSGSRTYTVTAFGDSSWTTTATFTLGVALTPPTASYPADSIKTAKGIDWGSLTPTVGVGGITGWTVSPALPSGMTLSSSGVITGIPTVESPRQLYSIFATGAAGIDTSLLYITVDPASEDYNTWSNHRSITINTSSTGANVAGTVTKYPLLVRLGTAESDIFSQALASGADVRFTKTNDLTRLPHETVLWNPTTKRAEIWVKVDTVKGNNSTQTIRMHWGSATATDSSSSGQVFNSSNGFVSVWHLGNAADSSARPNSVTGAPPATPVFFGGNPTYTAPTGIIGMADTLRGSAGAAAGNTNHDYISILTGTPFPGFTGYNTFTNGYTITAWVRPADTRNFTHFFDMNSDNSVNGFNTIYIGRNGVTSQLAYRNRVGSSSNGGNANANAATDIVNGAWQYFTVSKPNSTTVATVYNGKTAAGVSVVGSNVAIPDSVRKWVYMGKSFDATNAGFAGSLDEIRVANTTRNADWVGLDFESQKQFQLMTDIGIQPPTLVYSADSATYTEGVTISTVTPTITGTGVSISGTLPAGLAVDPVTGAITGTPTTPTAKTKYTITATNAGGSITDSIFIRINPTAPTALSHVTKTMTLIVGTTMTPDTATVTGIVDSFTVAPALPAGLALDMNTGHISGTPSAKTAQANYVVTARNVTGNSKDTISITVNNFAPTNLAYNFQSSVYAVGVPIDSNKVTVTGVVDSFTVAPELPAGLAFSKATGAITGTPSATAAIADYIVTAQNETGSSLDTVTITVNIAPPSALEYPQQSATYLAGTAISANTPSLTGVADTFTISPSLPTGLSLNPTNGSITGTPTTLTAQTDYIVSAINISGTAKDTVTITVNPVAPSALSYALDPATYIAGVTIDTNKATVTGVVTAWSISPSIGNGLAFNTATGAITGTPVTKATIVNYEITASNVTGSVKDTVSITVNNPAPTNLVYASQSRVYVVGTPIDSLKASVTGVVDSFTVAPTLPAGLSLSASTGIVTGTPSIATPLAGYIFTAHNETGTAKDTVAITVNGGVPADLVYPQQSATYIVGTPITANTPSFSGSIDTFTVAPALPAGLSLNVSTGSITGTPAVSAAQTEYVVTAANEFGSTKDTVTLTVNPAAPTALSYAHDPVIYIQGVTIDTNKATVTGVVTTWSISPAIGNGLVFNTSTGAITGTPAAQAAVVNYEITASNVTGSVKDTVSITVNHSAPSISYTTPHVYTVGIAITTLNVSSTGGPVTGYTISPDLNSQTGLVFNTTTGSISGTATVAHALTLYQVIATGPGGIDTATMSIGTSDELPPIISYVDSAVFSRGSLITNLVPDTAGTGPIDSFTVTPSLPAGLSLNAATGVISGTPSAFSAAANYTVTAVGLGGFDSEVIRLQVNDFAPDIAYAGPKTYIAGTALTILNPSSSGGAVVKYKITPNLTTNTGISFDTTTGTLSGTPTTAANVATYTIIATNSGGADTASLDITVLIAAPTISFLPSTVSDTVGTAATHSPVTTGTIASCSISPVIPGLTINPTTCVITGTPTTAASVSAFTVTARNSTDSALTTLNVAVLIAKPTLSFSPSTVSDTVGTAATHTPTSVGATSCGISPAIAGLSVNATTCAITGTPTTASAAANYTVTATNSTGSTSATLNVAVLIAKPTLSFSPSTVSDTVGTAATHTPTSVGATSCGISPAIAGLSVNATTCAITGTPTTASAAANYTVTATNSTGSTSTTLNVAVLIAKPTLSFSPSTVSDTVGTAATHTPTSVGATSCGISPAIAGLSVNATTCAITGTPTTASAAANYTVTATNSTGSTSATLNVAVLIAKPTLSFSPSTVSDTVGTAATHTPTSVGATSCGISPAIAGLSINATTCAITGTPTTASAAANYTVTATNSTGSTSTTLNVTVLIAKPTLSFSPSTVSDTIGKAATHTPTSVGATSCGISPTIPGLSINATTCAITGTPTTASAAANYTVTATNSTGSTSTTLNVTVLIAKPTLSFSPSTVSDTVGTAATHTPTSVGATSCGISPAIPGLSVNATTCAITGTPTTASAAANYTVTATNSTGSTSAMLNVAVLIAKPTLSFSPSTVSDTVGTAATHTPTSVGATSCGISPAIPGLSVNATTCAITGTPTTASTAANYTVTATNSTGSTSATLNVAVLIAKPTLSFSPSTVSDTVGTAATHTPTSVGATSCGISPAIAGLSVNATTCAITGTPTTASTAANYTVTATNSTGSTSATLNVAVLIAKPTLSFSPSTVSDTVGTAATHTPTSVGATSCGISPAIPGLSVNATTCAITGTPTTASAAANYTVTATNSTGSTSTTLNVTVLIAKPTLSFSPSTVSDTVGTAATHTPTSVGATSCGISPAIPGLSVNATTCAITGTPSTASALAAYTVTATNSTGSTSTTLNVAVLIAKPTLSFSQSTVSDTVSIAATHTPTSVGATSCGISPSIPGLTVNATTCAITGTPTTASASANYTVTATNSTGSTSTTLNVTVLAAKPTLSFSPSAVSDTVGIAAAHTPTSVGATSCGISPSIPGLSVNATTCAISGTPTTASSAANYTVTATNSTGSTSATLNVSVLIAKPTISFSPSTVSDTVGTAATHTPTTLGATSCGISPTIPGLSVNATTCAITGIPTTASAASNYTVTATNSTGSTSTTLNVAVLIAKPTLSFSPSTFVDTVGISNAHTPTSVGATSCGISPSIPGMTVNATTCAITGTPTTASSAANYTVTATNSTGSTATTLNMAVLIAKPTISYSPSTVVDTVGEPASHAASTSGTITSCSIAPAIPGLVINSTTCAITGTPSSSSSAANYTITATNSTGSTTATLNLAVLIPKPTVSYSPSTVVDTVGEPASHSATTSGTITSCSITPSIPGLIVNSTTCAISGTPTTAAPAANYTVTATNSTGSTSTTLNLAVLIAKPTVSFSPSTFVDTVGTTVTHTATTSGLITSCSLSPAIPGLIVNSTTCAILGTPTTVSALANYTVTASNATGSASTTIDVAVLMAKPTISYTPSTVSDTVGVVATHIASTTGTITSCSIAPAIAGLSVNPTTCAITGNPSSASSAANYTVTATNSTGSTNATINITVLIAKPTISYTPSAVSDTVGVVATHAASTTGTITSCSIAPSIAGLTVNATTCAITGTPTSASTAANYTVTASNTTGSATATINVTVLISKPTLSFSPSTVLDTVGRTVSHVPTSSGATSCSIAPSIPGLSVNAATCAITGTPTAAAEGANYTVTATNSTGSATATLNLTVLTALPAIAFTPATVVDTLGKVATHTPTSTGSILVCSIAPSIPGLSVNATTCAITGTPTTVLSASNYTVTATNTTGSSTATLNLAVVIAKPTLSYTLSTVVDTVGVVASHAATTSGSITACSIAPTIPGLSVNATTCAITGTPTTASAPSAYTVTATNSTGSATASLNIAVLISKPTLSYAPSTVVDTVGIAASHVATTTGGITSCSIAPAIPGLSVNTTTCAISGTPTTASASSAFTVTATNSTGSVSATLNITVLMPKPTLAFTPATVTDTVGIAASHIATTTGAITLCTIAPAIAGLTVNATTCAITGTPTAATSPANYTVTATNSTGSASATINVTVLIAKPTIAFTPATVVDTAGTVASHTPTTTGIITGCTIAPAIPGLTVNATTCAITGTPTTSSSAANYTVTATNSTGTTSATISVAVLIAKPTIVFTPAAVVDTVNKFVTHTPATTGLITSCSIAPAVPGVIINSTTCAISGTPTSAVPATPITVTATNSTGSASAILTVTVLISAPTNLAFAPDSVEFKKDTAIAAWTPTVTGTVTTWSITPGLPAGLVFSTTTGAITGTPTATSALTSYTVTASNGTGSTTKVIKIAVTEPVAILPDAFVFRVNGQEKPYAFQLPAGTTTEKVTLSIIDAWGRTIWMQSVNPSKNKITDVSWNGKSANGRQASAGMYIARVSVMNAGVTKSYVRKAVTLRPR